MHTKQLIKLLLTFALVFVMFSITSNISAKADDNGICGDNVKWEFKNGVLKLTGKGAMDNMTQYNQPWAGLRDQITKVVVSTGITTIGDNSFRSCSNLTSVSLPKSVTEIGEYAFCSTALKKITLPKKLEYVGEHAFFGCKNLESVKNLNVVKYIYSDAFYNCVSLKSVKLGNKLISLGDEAFASSGLTEIELPDSLEVMGDGCFKDCHSLKKAILPAKITRIPFYTFNYCGKLTEVIFRGNVSVIAERSFSGCEALESIEIPAGANKITIGPYAFANCKKLKKIVCYAYGWSTYDSIFFNADRAVIYGPKETDMSGLAKYLNVPYESVKMKVTVPEIVKASTKKNSISLKFSNTASNITYEISYSKNKDMSKAITSSTIDDNITIKKLTSGQIYYYQVRKCYRCNGKDYYSEWTDIQSIKVK